MCPTGTARLIISPALSFWGQLDLWEECCLFINLIITMISISMKHQGAAGVALQVEITAVS